MRITPRRTLVRAAAALLALAVAPACGNSSSSSASGSEAASPGTFKAKHAGTPDSPFLIGMSQCNLGEPWRVQMNADIKRAAAPYPNIKLLFKDAQNDSLTQRAQVEELVAQGIDILIISPKEAAPLTAPVAEAYRKGIAVIVLDRAVLGEEYTMFIGADNKKIGREAGKWAVKALGGKGKIVELKGLKNGEWAEAFLDFGTSSVKPRAGDKVDEIQFLLPRGAELLIDDLLLYEPGK